MSYPGVEFDALARDLLHPAEHRNPQPADRYHLVVVGAGPAGLISAIGAAGLGARVALVERGAMGGDCLNVGCVPSKALLEFTASRPEGSFDDAFRWLRQVRAGIAPHDSVARYTELGVDVFLGEARLNRVGDVVVDDMVLNARRVVLCSGARASLPDIPGLRDSEPLTNETVFDLQSQPAAIAILGAGPIGCELATVFARLGSEVHLFEAAPRVLPQEPERAGAVLAESLSRLGVHLHVGTPVQRVARNGGYQVYTEAGEVRADQALVALGRTPNTSDLGLSEAGVDTDERGFILTDKRLRTSRRTIYAAGDCTAELQFTHHADAQARVVVQNALFAPTASVAGMVVPRCTYTQPEVASVGLSAEQLKRESTPFDTYEVRFEELDRGRAEPEGGGYACVQTRRGSDRILGATLVGHDAGEQIAPICLLMSNGLGLGAASRTLINYPTRAEYLKRLADAYNRTRMTPLVARLFRAWLAFTR